MTEQESLAALLETAPPELREALTRGCASYMHGARGGRDYAPFTEQCISCHDPLDGPPGRVPLPLAEAHVALERFGIEHGWHIEIVQREWPYFVMLTPLAGDQHAAAGADIFEAVAAALGGT